MHTCNLVSKYRKAHSSVLEKIFILPEGERNNVKYLEVREFTYSKVFPLITAACFVSEI